MIQLLLSEPIGVANGLYIGFQGVWTASRGRRIHGVTRRMPRGLTPRQFTGEYVVHDNDEYADREIHKQVWGPRIVVATLSWPIKRIQGQTYTVPRAFQLRWEVFRKFEAEVWLSSNYAIRAFVLLAERDGFGVFLTLSN